KLETEQIVKSTERLKQDGWLLKKVSSYINELYNYYSLEGVNMPYTHEMFLKDHFPPEFHAQFMLGQEKGLQKGEQKGIQKGEEKGIQKGELIGSITALQKILKCKATTKKELRAKSIEELKAMLKELEKQIK
ncbi:MAG: hypothetical protein HQK67_11005, partial [Desulfamplus sp.]|nr:hypothetical protein [Desulfamplus sp.]